MILSFGEIFEPRYSFSSVLLVRLNPWVLSPGRFSPGGDQPGGFSPERGEGSAEGVDPRGLLSMGD